MEKQTNKSEFALPNPATQQLLEAQMTARAVASCSYPSVRDVLSKSDFISIYRQYADVYELPSQTHRWIALSLLAATLNGKVTIRHGDLTLPLDLWLLLLSPSGSGRDTSVAPARNLLKLAGLDILREEDFGSREAAYQQIAQKPCGLYLWPEFSVIMKKLSDGRFSGLREWFTGRYDSLAIPEAIKYRKHQGKEDSDTPPIEFFAAPRLNILATSARDWFTSNLEVDDTIVGFIPRWTIVNLPESGRIIPKPQRRNPKYEPFLVEFLRRASGLSGQADFSQVEEQYEEWYRRTKPQMKGPIEEPFFNRLRMQVLKFAVLAEVSKSLSIQVSPLAMERALELAGLLERNLKELFERGLSKTAGEISRIEDFIKAAGAEGRSKSEVTRKFQYMEGNDLKQRFGTLIESEAVVMFWRTGKGRPRAILVHQDFSEIHKQQFPEDKEGA